MQNIRALVEISSYYYLYLAQEPSKFIRKEIQGLHIRSKHNLTYFIKAMISIGNYIQNKNMLFPSVHLALAITTSYLSDSVATNHNNKIYKQENILKFREECSCTIYTK